MIHAPGRDARSLMLALVLVAGLPVAAAEGSSPAPERDSVLSQVTIDAADMPTGEAVAGLGWFQLDPASSVDSPPGSQPPSVAMELVLSGDYGVTTSGRTQVIRAGEPAAGSPAAAPSAGAAASPEERIQLGPGDTIVYLDNDDTEQLAETLGDAPVLAIAAGIFSTAVAQATPTVTGTWTFEFLAFADAAAWATVPEGPLTLTLRRAADAPAESPPPGTIRLSGSVPGQEGVFVLTIEPAPAG